MSFTKGVFACLALALVCRVADVNASSIVLDPVGDTLAMGFPDITSIETTLTNDTITFLVMFADMILPFPPSVTLDMVTPNMIEPRIDLDIDQNPLTGFTPITNRLTESRGYPPISLGAEFTVGIGGSVAPLDARVVDSEFNHLAFVVPNAVTYAPKSVSITLPLVLLHDDGLINYSVFVFGGLAGPADRAPNGTTPFTTAAGSDPAPVPESTTVVLLGTGLAALAVRRVVRKPQSAAD